MGHPVLEHLRTAFAAVDDVCSSLTDPEWDLPTECPGWSVKDNLAHLCGIEAGLLGKARPGPIAQPWPTHVRDEFAARNEGDLVARRSVPGPEVLEEYRELVSQRLKALEQLTDEEWRAETQGVMGKAPLGDVLAIRVVDVYYHEQDIRRGANRPGHLDGATPQFVLERMQTTIPRSLVKKARAPAGTTLFCDVTTPPGRSFALEVRDDNRAYEIDPPPHPTVAMRTTSEGLLRFLGGRWNIEEAIEDGRVQLEGDARLGRDILNSLAATP